MKIAVVTDVMGKSPEPEYREQYFNVKTLESVLDWISEASDMEAEITGKELEYHIVSKSDPSGMGWDLQGVKALVVADTVDDWEMITDVLEMTSR